MMMQRWFTNFCVFLLNLGFWYHNKSSDNRSDWVKNVNINRVSIDEDVANILSVHRVNDDDVKAALLLKAISLVDLTTLSGDDTESNVTRLTLKACNPVPLIQEKLEITLHTAAVCVYPTKVACVASNLSRKKIDDIGIASVATGFPTGLYPLSSRLLEIAFCVQEGATEIDVVIDRSLVLTGQWETLFNEISQMKKAVADKALLKVILGVGELGTYTNIYKAAMVAMVAGADFIKTSTGKEAVNATLPIGLVMCRAIRDYFHLTKRRVGLKPAGGLKTPQDAIDWMILVKETLGVEWLDKKLFRIGASSLLDGIEHVLNDYVIGN